MLLTFPECHGRWLLLIVCAKMLQRALPHSHFSPVIADDIKIVVTTPTNLSAHSLVSTVQVVLHPRDRRQLGCHFLTYPRQALVAGRKAQLAKTMSVLFSYWSTFLWSLSPPALITLCNQNLQWGGGGSSTFSSQNSGSHSFFLHSGCTCISLAVKLCIGLYDTSALEWATVSHLSLYFSL